MSTAITVDDSGLREKLALLASKVKNMTSVFEDIGDIVVASVRENFQAQGRFLVPGSWFGGSNKWQALKAATVASRKAEGHWGDGARILTRSGRLSKSITPRASATDVVVGTNVKYAAIHNFGGTTKPHDIVAKHKKALAWPGGNNPVKKVHHPGSTIPARPFLVVQDSDLKRMAQVIHDHITEKLNG